MSAIARLKTRANMCYSCPLLIRWSPFRAARFACRTVRRHTSTQTALDEIAKVLAAPAAGQRRPSRHPCQRRPGRQAELAPVPLQGALARSSYKGCWLERSATELAAPERRRWTAQVLARNPNTQKRCAARALHPCLYISLVSVPWRIDLARGGMPFRSVRLLSKGRTCDERHSQVPGIVNDCRHSEPFRAVRLMMPIEIFGQYGIFAVRHTILSQIAGRHVCSHDFKVASGETASSSFRKTEPETSTLRLLRPGGF